MGHAMGRPHHRRKTFTQGEFFGITDEKPEKDGNSTDEKLNVLENAEPLERLMSS